MHEASGWEGKNVKGGSKGWRMGGKMGGKFGGKKWRAEMG